MTGQILKEKLQKTNALLALEIAVLIWAEKESFESRMIPRCLCSVTFFTGMLLKRITGWSISCLFFERSNSTACFCGSGLNDILQLWAHWLINPRSWFMFSAAAFGSWTTVNNDVSSAKSLTLHFKSAVRSLIYTRKNNGPNIDPWGTPAKISPQLEHWPFRTVRCFRSLRKLWMRQRSCPATPHRFSL